MRRCVEKRIQSVPRHHFRGFTLIELMIVVAIVGILAAVAYPSYQDHVRKGNRAAAQAFMMEVAQRQQQYLLNNRSYAESLAALGCFSPDADGDCIPDDVDKFYSVSGSNLGVNNGPPPSFLLQLNPVSTSLQSGDGALCLASSGSRSRNCQDGGTPESW